MMRYVIVLLAMLFPFITVAQIMDDTDINKLESGKYTIEKGKVQVDFIETATPDFIKREMDDMGLKMLSSDFQPIMLRVNNIPDDLTLEEFESNKRVDFVMKESVGITDEDWKKLEEKDSLMSKSLKDLKKNGAFDFIMVALTYSATEASVEEIRGNYPEMDIKIAVPGNRSAVIKTEEGKELEVMDRLKRLKYVKNTAMVGSLE